MRGLTPETAEELGRVVEGLGIEVLDGPVMVGALAGLDAAEREDPRPVAEAIRRGAAGMALAPKASVVVDGGGALHLEGRGGGRAGAGAGRAVPGRWRAWAASMRAGRRRRRCAPLARPGERERGGAAAVPVGRFALRTGEAVGVGVAFGQMEAAALAGLAAAVGDGELRPAAGRGLIALGVAAEGFRTAAEELGFVVDAADPRLSIVACSGAPACASAWLATRALAAEIAGRPEMAAGVRLHLSGCGKRCAQPAGPCVSLVAGEAGNEILGEGMAVPAGLRRLLARVPQGGQRPARPTHPPAGRPLPSSRAGGRGVREGSLEYIRDGAAIYARSFAIIRAEADLARFSEEEAEVAVRMIHACGLVEAAAAIRFAPGFVAAARAALAAGAPILCDAEMVAHGVTRARLPAGNEVVCTLRDPAVPGLAERLGTTRSAAALELWRERLAGAVVAVGNAPTALFHLLEMLAAGAAASGGGDRDAGRLRRRGGIEGGAGRGRCRALGDRRRADGGERHGGGGGQRAGEGGDLSGRLIGVGTGPGDPELLTLKAVRALAAADVVAHFAKAGRSGNARATVAGFLRPGVEELALSLSGDDGGAVARAGLLRGDRGLLCAVGGGGRGASRGRADGGGAERGGSAVLRVLHASARASGAEVCRRRWCRG